MDFPLPPVGEGLFEVELVRWLVQPGEAVHRGQALMEVMSDKATMEVPAPFAGTVTGTLAEPGDKIKVGAVVLRYEPEGQAATSSSAKKRAEELVAAAPPPLVAKSNGELSSARNGTSEPVHADEHSAAPPPAAAPSVRHLARKLGIDLTHVHGTGPAGRILLEDLAPHIAKKPAAAGDAHARPHRNHLPRSGLNFGVAGTRMKMLGLRRKIAEHMTTAMRAIPHYSYIDECDLTDLVRLRTQLKETFGRAGVRLTYLPFFVKAAARALKEIPIVNCTYDEAAEEMVLHDRYDIGIAVAAPNGLVVPVIRDADKKDVAAIATEIDRLSNDARAGRPKAEDLRGGTFTVTSIGGIGGLISTPIINHPEVGIMGVGKVVRRPVYDAHGALRPADLIYLSFSFDHRVVDGAVGAAFGNVVIRHLQNPATLLLPERFGS
ncbi:dihydrolipoamide acetyltransferase family protein [Fimbriiglobus ruber]|uniref:Dihydrolipoamide acetyltransferase component of pyruvate dehydrogenase complex n=1 Tax=Fimbriiglobus ruber TaxID=1908690 RepID=A0A225DYI1_9BACT|nr:dihydrolipoamide acetyltransferase family protein [Fimbriiglobus ruber]OWK42309.1 Dihydrolipoamide acyltransferase component of branched-chain alpha-keto acid dehydrogenase complex [Fimbriiglobus ruber]